MYKFAKRVYTPTPVFWRLLGDSILYGLGSVSINSILSSNHEVGVALIVVAMLGKFLSNIPVQGKKKGSKHHDESST